jgi:cyclase
MLLHGPFLLLGLLFWAPCAEALPAGVELVCPGVWFLLGDAHKGYSNTVVIEMARYLIVVDANYPGRAKELIALMPEISSKPVRYVFDTHAHGDHSYGNSTWTRAGAKTMAFAGVVKEMNRWEPGRWRMVESEARRADLRELGEQDVERPKRVIEGKRLVLKDRTRQVDFLFLGWGHTPGDGYVWLPKERVLATGDGAVNGPRNKLLDASIAHWPEVLQRAIALRPRYVLPGHGERGGPEILTGQRRFLLDLFSAVKRETLAGETPQTMSLVLPAADANWVPASLEGDIAACYAEIQAGAPAGSLPHEWR